MQSYILVLVLIFGTNVITPLLLIMLFSPITLLVFAAALRSKYLPENIELGSSELNRKRRPKIWDLIGEFISLIFFRFYINNFLKIHFYNTFINYAIHTKWNIIFPQII